MAGPWTFYIILRALISPVDFITGMCMKQFREIDSFDLTSFLAFFNTKSDLYSVTMTNFKFLGN